MDRRSPGTEDLKLRRGTQRLMRRLGLTRRVASLEQSRLRPHGCVVQNRRRTSSMFRVIEISKQFPDSGTSATPAAPSAGSGGTTYAFRKMAFVGQYSQQRTKRVES
jgi:hypothetical protein